MGPIIILDKSAFQSLSADEVRFLSRYFTLNIPPVLGVEILGDLKKEDPNFKSTYAKVASLARKLGHSYSSVNVHFRHLVTGSLLGHPVAMDGSIVLPGGSLKRTEEGESGIVFEESPEEKTINRWRLGRFDDAEEVLAERWQKLSRSIDLEQIKSKVRGFLREGHHISSFDEVLSIIDASLSVPHIQVQFLRYAIEEFDVSQPRASEAFYRWESGRWTDFKSFAPYAAFCVRVTIAFYLALASDIVTTKPTNRIDLEYLYYLPFTEVFSSRDKFHGLLAPELLREDQTFIDGDELKSDLKGLADNWRQMDESRRAKWLESYRDYPPNNESPMIYNLWQKYMRPEHEIRDCPKLADIDPGKKDEFVERVMKTLKNSEDISSGDGTEIDVDTMDFVISERMIFPDDPCPCGSGKTFRDCHFSRVKHKRRDSEEPS